MKPESTKFTTFINTLKLTSSENDGEALSAIRAANRLLQQFGGDWEQLLRGRVTLIADPFTSIPEPKSTATPNRQYNPPAPPPRPRPPTSQSPPQQASSWRSPPRHFNIPNPNPRTGTNPTNAAPPKPNQWTHSGSPAAKPLYQAPKPIRRKGPRRTSTSTDDLAL